jgi:hypothetical protein
MTVYCAYIQSGECGVVSLEIPSLDSSVTNPNQDCEEKHMCEVYKSKSEFINLPRESLQKMINPYLPIENLNKIYHKASLI